MKYIDLLIHPKDNIEELTYLAVRDLHLKITKKSVLNKLKEHPNYPSLFSIHDTLLDFGIDSIAIKCNDVEKFIEIDGSFIVQVKADQELFAYIFKYEENNIEWYNPQKHKRESISIKDFNKIYTGYILLLEVKENAGEENYKLSHAIEVRQQIIENLLILVLPIFLVISVLHHITTNNLFWQGYLYALFLFAGCVTGCLLLVHGYNEYSPVLSNLCHRSTKINCSAVLSSKGSQLLGIPWSVIGTAYFLGMLMALLISNFDIHVYCSVTIIHVLALPYVIYSVFYQKAIVKQWCPLCLITQIIILLLFVTALLSNTYSQVRELTFSSLLCIAGCLFLSSILLYFLWLFTQQLKTKEYYKRLLCRIKYDPTVFNALLKKERKIAISTDDFGITLGKKNGNFHIIKVCNPYCHHCAAAQPILQKLLTVNDNIKLQMIFPFDPSQKEYKFTPIDTFLSLYYEGADMESAFSDWYETRDKNIEKYRYNHCTKEQNTERNITNAKAMLHFCETMEIIDTPTFFVNGYKLPDLYNASELKYFC